MANGVMTPGCLLLGRRDAFLLTTQIAPELGTRETAIKFHRGQVMHKMQAASVAELVRMTPPLGLPAPRYEPAYTKV